MEKRRIVFSLRTDLTKEEKETKKFAFANFEIVGKENGKVVKTWILKEETNFKIRHLANFGDRDENGNFQVSNEGYYLVFKRDFADLAENKNLEFEVVDAELVETNGNKLSTKNGNLVFSKSFE